MSAGKTHDPALEEGLVHNDETLAFIPVTKAHDVGVASVSIDTTHHTLIIAEEEDGESGDAVDKDQQRPLLVATSHIEFGHTIHGDSVPESSLGVEEGVAVVIREVRVPCDDGVSSEGNVPGRNQKRRRLNTSISLGGVD